MQDLNKRNNQNEFLINAKTNTNNNFQYSIFNDPNMFNSTNQYLKQQNNQTNTTKNKTFSDKNRNTKSTLKRREDDSLSINTYSSSTNNKNKFHYFVPWKRAEADPSLVKVGTEIHINPLPPDVNHEDLYSFFKMYGEIIDLRIIPRKEKGTNFAFLRFLELESVDKVLKEKNMKFRGFPIRISKSKEETTIFIGNIKKTWTQEYVENLLRERVPNFDQLKFFVDSNNPSKNRGYCFLKFYNPLLAKEAYDKLCKNIVIDGTSLTIDWADDFSEDDINRVQIHLSGLRDTICTEDIYSIFSQFGEIINIKLARDMEGKGRKDYGFITYSKEEEAARLISEFKWKNYFDYPVNIQYARKISSIIKHKQKIQGDMLERKRRRDNLINKQIKYNNTYDSDDSPKNIQNKIINDFTNLINTFSSDGQSNLNEVMTQMMGMISTTIMKNNETLKNNFTGKTNDSLKNFSKSYDQNI